MKSVVSRILCCIGLMLGLASFAAAADQTLVGQISDNMCGASHAKMMSAHADAKMTARDCTLACVKAGGKYVFVSDGKVYQIANQGSPLLMQHAGHANVSLTGDVQGDTITVSKVVMPAKKAT